MNEQNQNEDGSMELLKKNYAAIPDGQFAEGLLERLKSELPAQRTSRRSVWPMAITSIAATVIFCIGLGLYFIAVRTSGITFAQVAEAVSRTHTFTAMNISGVGQLSDMEKIPGRVHILVKNSVMRTEFRRGGIEIWNVETGERLNLDPDQHIATVEYWASQPFDLYSLFKEYHTGEEKVLGQKIVGNIHAQGFELTHSALIPGNGKVIWTFWVDPDTKLPILVETKPATEAIATGSVYSDFHFDVTLDDSLFSMAIPAGYSMKRALGTPSSQLAPPPTTQEAAQMTLVPLIGIGSVHFGATRDEVMAILGRPESGDMSKPRIFLASKGLIIHFDHNDRMNEVDAYHALNYPINSFGGKTDKGIGIGATQAEVEAAYGKNETTSLVANGMWLVLEYEKLNLSFLIIDGRVDSIGFGTPSPDIVDPDYQQCADNMSKIYGLLNPYALNRNGDFPPNWQALFKNTTAPATIFICPGTGTQSPSGVPFLVDPLKLSGDAEAQWIDQNSDFFYIPGSTEKDLRNVLLYEKDTNHHGEGMHVLYVDGHVEWMSLDEAHREIERTRAATRPSPATKP